MNRRLPALAALALAAAGAGAPAAADPPGPATARVYDFEALLDGKPMGRHRFVVTGDAAARSVDSEAEFVVRFLGFSAFHYHHHASEQWKGNCLQSLTSTTDDDGKPTSVRSRAEGDVYRIRTPGAEAAAPACTMSYAYWNPAMREQAHLLNPQTGKVDAVRIERVGSGTIEVGGKPVAATQYRITGPESPVDVWYSAQGDWIGLDSIVGGKHKLSYRLS